VNDKNRNQSATVRRAHAARTLRIIGGRHRGRRLRFPPLESIRPTPDRVRETLFNWLQGHLDGSRCLDLFAGSGVLGLEALSRGAARVCLVESDRQAAKAIGAVLTEWQESSGTVVQRDAIEFLREPSASPWGGPFDVVFLDPPFAAGLLGRSAEWLERADWLAPMAWIYLENRAREPLPALPLNWRPLKSGRAGEVEYHLWVRHAAALGVSGG